MNDDVNTEMLILARESRGMTQTDLAKATDLPQYTISRYESGVITVKDEHLDRIADALDYPSGFFFTRERRFGFGSSCTHHRKRASTLIRELNTAEASINIHRIRMMQAFRSVDIDSDIRFTHLDLEKYDGNVEEIARLVRSQWSLPYGPITNLTDAIERAGGIAVKLNFGTNKIDALSQWLANTPPLFIINSQIPTDRLRWSLAHEIGHLVMHRIPTPEQEKEADRFAAELLMPRRDITADLQALNFNDLARLKSYWKVSMQAIIRRAHDLGKINDARYKTMMQNFSRMGYRTREPQELPEERPTMIKEILDFHQLELGYSIPELCKMLMISEEELYKIYLPQKIQPLRLVG